VPHVETEREKELTQQLKQANNTAARLQDELRQAQNRERQLQMQLHTKKDDASQLQMQKKEVDDTAQSKAVLLEQEMKKRASKIPGCIVLCNAFYNRYFYDYANICVCLLYFNLTLSWCNMYIVHVYKEFQLSSVPHVETEREKDVTQKLKQANDTVARPKQEVRQAEHRERHLQMQLDKQKDGASQLQLQKKEVDDTAQSKAVLLEQEMKKRASKIPGCMVLCICIM